MDLLARLARQEGLRPLGARRNGTSVTSAFVTPDAGKSGDTRTILCTGPDHGHLDRLQISYQAPVADFVLDHALGFVNRVLEPVLPPAQRAAAADWIGSHRQGGVLELPGAAVVLARTEASESGVSCSQVFTRDPVVLPAGRRPPRASPIRVPEVMAYNAREGLVRAERTQGVSSPSRPSRRRTIARASGKMVAALCTAPSTISW